MKLYSVAAILILSSFCSLSLAAPQLSRNDCVTINNELGQINLRASTEGDTDEYRQRVENFKPYRKYVKFCQALIYRHVHVHIEDAVPHDRGCLSSVGLQVYNHCE